MGFVYAHRARYTPGPPGLQQAGEGKMSRGDAVVILKRPATAARAGEWFGPLHPGN